MRSVIALFMASVLGGVAGPAAAEPPGTDGSAEAPSGLEAGGPPTVADRASAASRTDAPFAPFPWPSEFKRETIDPAWHPTSAWNIDPMTQNDFAPSRWAQASIDPTWRPTAVFDVTVDVLADSRSAWRQSPIDPIWKPTDGFEESVRGSSEAPTR